MESNSNRVTACPDCYGSGFLDLLETMTCVVCGGLGKLKIVTGQVSSTQLASGAREIAARLSQKQREQKQQQAAREQFQKQSVPIQGKRKFNFSE
jgi:RecJ-like exonuclease